MTEWYERDAESGSLSTVCACEAHIVEASVAQIRAGYAVFCKLPRCKTVAATMNGERNGGDSSTVAVPKMR